MTGSRDSPWRYGVYAFVLGPLLSLAVYGVAYGALYVLESPTVGVELGGFALVAILLAVLLLGAVSYLLAAVVLFALVADAKTLREETGWAPNVPLVATLGVVHFLGALLTVPYLVSIPGIGYYLVRRRRHVPAQ